MKKSLIKLTALMFAVILVFTSGIVFSPLSNANADVVSEAVVNGGFETDGESYDFYGTTCVNPHGWVALSKGIANLDSAVKYDGEKSVKLSSSSNFSFSAQSNFQVENNSYYEFGFMVYTTSLEKISVGLEVVIYNSKGVSEKICSVTEFFPTEINAWEKVSVFGGTSDDAKSAHFTIKFAHTGKKGCYIDGVFMQKQDVVSIKEGASVRLSGTSSGIRFSGAVDKNVYEKFENEYSNVCAGIVIIPKVYYDDLTDFTFAELDKEKMVRLDIVAEKWNNTKSLDTDGFYGFNCAMINIKKANIVQKFCARAYLRYTENGVVKYVYSDFNVVDNVRSIQEVAKSVMEKEGNDCLPEEKTVLEYYISGGATTLE